MPTATERQKLWQFLLSTNLHHRNAASFHPRQDSTVCCTQMMHLSKNNNFSVKMVKKINSVHMYMWPQNLWSGNTKQCQLSHIISQTKKVLQIHFGTSCTGYFASIILQCGTKKSINSTMFDALTLLHVLTFTNFHYY